MRSSLARPGCPPRWASSGRCVGPGQRAGLGWQAVLSSPRLGQSRLDSLGSIQGKITVCAWASSCPPLRERVSPSKEPCSRAAVEPDLAELGYGKGVTAPQKDGVMSLPGKGSAHHVPGSGNLRPATASPTAAVQSPIQLQAQRPHYKHKPLRRLEGMPAGRPGGARLRAALEEAAELDPAACCCRGKGTPAGQAPEDWPGSMAREQQQTALLQHRTQDGRPSSPSFLVPLQQPLEHGCPPAAGRNLLGVKHLALVNLPDPRASKRSRAPVPSPGSRDRHRSCPQMLSTQHVGAQGQQQAGPLPRRSRAGDAESPESKEADGSGWEERAPRLEQHLAVPRDARSQASSSSFAETPDYLRKYHPICSAEQRRAYEAAFSADYTEYRNLHTRIGNVSQKFIQLGAKRKALKQGTQERKAVEAAIVHEYSRFKKTYPGYQQEKNRCEYLHQKLSHIKSLILQFEGSGSS